MEDVVRTLPAAGPEPAEDAAAIVLADDPRERARQLLDDFLKGRKKTTIAGYRGDIAHYARWRGLEPAAAVAELLASEPGDANTLALRYRTSMVEAGRAPATVNRRLSALRSIVRLARKLGRVAFVLDVERVKSVPLRDTRGPGLAGYRKLIALAELRDDAKGLRDRAILHLLWDLALRRGEIASLDVAHFELEGKRLSVLGKGKNEREWLSLPAPTRAALEAWLAARGAERGPLFVSLDRFSPGHRLTGLGVWKVVKRMGERVGLRVRPHALRHAAITTALDLTNGDVRLVRQFSRHARLEEVARYDDQRQDRAGMVAGLVAAAAASDRPIARLSRTGADDPEYCPQPATSPSGRQRGDPP